MIKEISINDYKKWDDIVRSFDGYEVFYLAEYVRTFMEESTKNGEPILLLYETNVDRAINVVFKRDIAYDKHLLGKVEKGKYYDLITPYGYGGFMGDVEKWEDLNREYREYCVTNGYICEFVRFELFSDYHLHYDGEVETRTHNIVRDLSGSIDEIWMDFKQKVRKNVKKANRYNLDCIIENTGVYLDDFLRIYYSTMDRTNADNEYYFSRGFFERLNTMQGNVMYFHAVYKGKIVSTELVIYGDDNCYSYLGGTDREYFDVRPNDFLKYEIIKWAKDKGLKSFVLGGGYGADDGIYQYKLCLAPDGVRDFYIGRRIFDENKYTEFVSLRGKDKLNERFFPLYRS